MSAEFVAIRDAEDQEGFMRLTEHHQEFVLITNDDRYEATKNYISQEPTITFVAKTFDTASEAMAWLNSDEPDKCERQLLSDRLPTLPVPNQKRIDFVAILYNLDNPDLPVELCVGMEQANWQNRYVPIAEDHRLASFGRQVLDKHAGKHWKHPGLTHCTIGFALGVNKDTNNVQVGCGISPSIPNQRFIPGPLSFKLDEDEIREFTNILVAEKLGKFLWNEQPEPLIEA